MAWMYVSWILMGMAAYVVAGFLLQFFVFPFKNLDFDNPRNMDYWKENYFVLILVTPLEFLEILIFLLLGIIGGIISLLVLSMSMLIQGVRKVLVG